MELLQTQTVKEDFWNDNLQAQQILKRISQLKESIERFDSFDQEAHYLRDVLEMAQAENEQELFMETSLQIEAFLKKYQAFELLIFFAGEHDTGDAIVSLHAGTGGTEAQDWAEMLLRMYTRWAEASGYETEIIDFQAGDEAGVKSVTMMVRGLYAYGKMKCEEGVHRLIRVSPFDSSGRRHTSFAAVSVLPEISEVIDIVIDPDDLRIDTFRSSGAGGQHVNKTDSAIRITHLPTGIVVQCQSERSQHSNRLSAMKILNSRLYELRQREIETDLLKHKGDYKEISWGSQIRTYTLNPFNLVKDHRTGYEDGNVQGVLDGDLDGFINACLKNKQG